MVAMPLSLRIFVLATIAPYIVTVAALSDLTAEQRARGGYDSLLRREQSEASHQQQHPSRGSDDEWRTWWRLGGSKAASAPEVASIMEIEVVEGGSKRKQSTPAGLPFSDEKAPTWLVKKDGLVVDARKTSEKAAGGGMLIVHVVSQDASRMWETKSPQRPNWLRAILAANRHHAEQFGHAMVLRWDPTQPQLTDWQIKNCKKEKLTDVKCHDNNERENINWEKHLMLVEYLKSAQNFSHVLMLDADAMFVRPDLDTMRRMAAILEENGKDLFVSDEDWLQHGQGRINGGVLLAKNTAWTRTLFDDLWNCHRKMWIPNAKTVQNGELGCTSNEMIALNDIYLRPGVKDKIHLASGRRWNRGGEVLYRHGENDADENMYKKGMNDPDLEIMHFMGAAKFGAVDVVCNKKYGMVWNLTGQGPSSYGCTPVVDV